MTHSIDPATQAEKSIKLVGSWLFVDAGVAIILVVMLSIMLATYDVAPPASMILQLPLRGMQYMLAVDFIAWMVAISR